MIIFRPTRGCLKRIKRVGHVLSMARKKAVAYYQGRRNSMILSTPKNQNTKG